MTAPATHLKTQRPESKDQMDSADHLDNGQVDEGADEGEREEERKRKK